jgi:hypothetical protein
MTKFLDPRAIEETIVEIAEIAARERADVVLVGGVAMEIYGSDRMTKDVDFASLTMLEGVKIVKPLSFGGYAAKSTATGHPVDIIVRSDEYSSLYAEAIDHAVDAGLPVRVVSPEYLAATKMAAGRDKDEMDLKTLIRLGVIDVAKTRSIVKSHLGEYAARELDSLCDEVAWHLSRGK